MQSDAAAGSCLQAAPEEQNDVTKAVLAARKLKRELADADAAKKAAAEEVRGT